MFQKIEDDRQHFFVRNLISVVDGRTFQIGGDAVLPMLR